MQIMINLGVSTDHLVYLFILFNPICMHAEIRKIREQERLFSQNNEGNAACDSL